MKKLTAVQRSARDQDCTVEIAGICNGDVSTTVLAHLSFQYGTDKRNRPNERNAVYACSKCHDEIGSWSDLYGMEIARALVRTAEARDRMGI